MPVLAAVTLLAAACSSGPTGQVGSTLAALNGTVTLDKVLSPAPVEPGSAVAVPGQKLVAVVLTVHSPAGSAAKFASIYHNSKLIDSQKAAHVGRSTTRFEVAACVAYPPFSTLGPGLSATGCDVFSMAVAATPVELVISGKAKGDWKIASTAVQPGPEAAPVAPPVRTTPTTVAPGTLSAEGSTTTTAAGSPGTTTTTALAAIGPTGRRPHHVASKAPKVSHVTPRAGPVGSRVQIWGKHLNGVTEVTFNGVPAPIEVTTGGKLVVVVPDGASAGPIVVTTRTGTATDGKTFFVL
ncbi:MAG TPA: IPT/TIG domain-containing protein [Acidimicrobiales bacterium]|nr:IPT/TIG domain-containing protein [Acidimicrobiales bacterium]